ncbi:MAG: glycosyltransferase family 2 protein [Clostridiales bacterium]|nr:glycosyltransferase family 2 protein [Clostridiales bacterium]
MNHPVVSIIIPIYNAAAHLFECIASARSQTLAEIELLCVDDGSTDSSLELLHALANEEPRIRIFRQPNSGAGAARNLALSEARGKYISFLDADDRYASDTCLRELYDAARRMGASICGGFRQILNPNGTVTLHSLFRRDLKRKPQGVKIAYKDFQYDYHYQNFLFQQELLKRHQITFPLYRRFQDPPFLIRAMIAAKEFAVVPVEVYLYRRSERPVVWDAEKVGGLIKGLTDDLNLSRQANLPKLHALTVRRIEQDFYEAITGCLDLPEIYDLCIEANASVNVALLKGQRSTRGDFLLLPLQACLQKSGSSSNSAPRSFRSSGDRFRAAHGFIQCIHDHGIGYTIRRGIEHLGIPMNAELSRSKSTKKK